MFFQEKTRVTTDSVSSLGGALNGDPGSDDGEEELSQKDVKRVEKEIQRLENQHTPVPHTPKRTLKGTSTAVRLAQRLSPKSHRKNMTEESLIKVSVLTFSVSRYLWEGLQITRKLYGTMTTEKFEKKCLLSYNINRTAAWVYVYAYKMRMIAIE